MEVTETHDDDVVSASPYQSLLLDHNRSCMALEDHLSRQMRDIEQGKKKPGPTPRPLAIGDIVHLDIGLLITLRTAFGLVVDPRTRFEIVSGPKKFVPTVDNGPGYRLQFNGGPEKGKQLEYYYPASALERA